jgi:hypothetical protein
VLQVGPAAGGEDQSVFYPPPAGTDDEDDGDADGDAHMMAIVPSPLAQQLPTRRGADELAVVPAQAGAHHAVRGGREDAGAAGVYGVADGAPRVPTHSRHHHYHGHGLALRGRNAQQSSLGDGRGNEHVMLKNEGRMVTFNTASHQLSPRSGGRLCPCR